MKFDHIGVVVRSLDAGIRLWEEVLGYRRVTDPIDQRPQQVRVVFLEKEGAPTVKLVEPMDRASPAATVARRGGGLHHLCYAVDDLEAGIRALEEQGGRVLVRPEPGGAFDQIAFVHVGQGLVVELVDSSVTLPRLDEGAGDS